MDTTASNDVVVVGGGSAGCVLASRLSENPSRRVLLLEAGADYASADDLPIPLADGWGPVYEPDWSYRSEPDGPGDPLELPRAKVIGGCSSTNATCALRGAPTDYDAWASAGNTGWAFSDLLPYFRRLEADADFGSDEWHGQSGPLPIRRYREDELHPFAAAGVEAARVLGHRWVPDLNHPHAVGVGPMPANTVDGLRMSTSLTYLRAARHRANLTIRPHSHVDRVVVRNGRAVAVVLARGGDVIPAGRIVLTAGSYGSPAILLRSGIGSANELRRLGIQPVADLVGVGRNLIDHPMVMSAVPIDPLPAGPRFQVIATWRSHMMQRGSDGFDMQLVVGRTGPFEPSPTGEAGFVAAALMKPRSRGWLRLRSADPTAPPRIRWAFTEHPEDVERLVEGVRRARRMLRTAPLANLAAGPELLPGPEVSDQKQAITEHVRHSAGTYHHPVGTCAMGTDPDQGAVVDSHGCVYGVAGLTVADASAMPDIPAANTNVPTIMLAERISDLLR